MYLVHFWPEARDTRREVWNLFISLPLNECTCLEFMHEGGIEKLKGGTVTRMPSYWANWSEQPHPSFCDMTHETLLD